MQILIDNVLRILNPTDEIKKYCKEELEIDNPQFLQNKRLGFSNYNVPKKLCWYEKRGNDIIIPFGCLKKIYAIYPKKEDYQMLIPQPKKIKYKSNIKLFDYQEEAKEKAIKAKNGVIVMCAGAGKTQTALQIIAELGLKTLWLVHTRDLLNQSYSRAKDNLEDIKISKIENGKIDISEGITFATIQTLFRTDLSQYKNEWDCIFVDEGHRICRDASTIGYVL